MKPAADPELARRRAEQLEKLLAAGKDGALLRFGLGGAWLAAGDAAAGARHLAEAVRLDPDQSAAWKLLGKAHAETGAAVAALAAWRRGIDVATARGDVQAAREMTVFVRRLEKQQEAAKP